MILPLKYQIYCSVRDEIIIIDSELSLAHMFYLCKKSNNLWVAAVYDYEEFKI